MEPKRRPKWIQKGGQNGAKKKVKMDPKLSQKGTQNGPKKELKMEPKRGSKWSQKGAQNGAKKELKTDLKMEPKWSLKWGQERPHKWIQNGPRGDPHNESGAGCRRLFLYSNNSKMQHCPYKLVPRLEKNHIFRYAKKKLKFLAHLSSSFSF